MQKKARNRRGEKREGGTLARGGGGLLERLGKDWRRESNGEGVLDTQRGKKWELANRS